MSEEEIERYKYEVEHKGMEPVEEGTVKCQTVRTPEKFAVITLKFEQDGN